MSSPSADLADALKTDLDGQSYPVTLTTAREYLVPLKRTELGSAKRVSIFPFELRAEREGRNGSSNERGIGLILRAAVDPTDASAVDDLVETVEDMIARYLITPIDYGASANAIPTGITLINGDQLYDVDLLGQSRIFQGGFITTYTTRT